MLLLKKELIQFNLYQLLQQKSVILFYQSTPIPVEEWEGLKKAISLETRNLSKQSSTTSKNRKPFSKDQQEKRKAAFTPTSTSELTLTSLFHESKISILLSKGKVARQAVDKEFFGNPAKAGQGEFSFSSSFRVKQVEKSGGLEERRMTEQLCSKSRCKRLTNSSSNSNNVNNFPLQGNTVCLGVDSPQQLALVFPFLKKKDHLFLLGGLYFGKKITHLDVERLITLQEATYPIFIARLRAALLPFLRGKNCQSGGRFLSPNQLIMGIVKMMVSFPLFQLKLVKVCGLINQQPPNSRKKDCRTAWTRPSTS